jgi:hypothetical protein
MLASDTLASAPASQTVGDVVAVASESGVEASEVAAAMETTG